MKVEVAVLGFPVSNSPYGHCGHKAALKKKTESNGSSKGFDSRRGPPGMSLIVLTVSVHVKQH